MKRLLNNNDGQMILITCVSIALALVLIAVYELSILDTGEKSINRENMNSFYYYKNVRDRYIDVYKDPYLNLSKETNITRFENELREFSLLHGYSVAFVRNGTQAKIIFTDKDIRIEETIDKGT